MTHPTSLSESCASVSNESVEFETVAPAERGAGESTIARAASVRGAAESASVVALQRAQGTEERLEAAPVAQVLFSARTSAASFNGAESEPRPAAREPDVAAIEPLAVSSRLGAPPPPRRRVPAARPSIPRDSINPLGRTSTPARAPVPSTGIERRTRLSPPPPAHEGSGLDASGDAMALSGAELDDTTTQYFRPSALAPQAEPLGATATPKTIWDIIAEKAAKAREAEARRHASSAALLPSPAGESRARSTPKTIWEIVAERAAEAREAEARARREGVALPAVPSKELTTREGALGIETIVCPVRAPAPCDVRAPAPPRAGTSTTVLAQRKRSARESSRVTKPNTDTARKRRIQLVVAALLLVAAGVTVIGALTRSAPRRSTVSPGARTQLAAAQAMGGAAKPQRAEGLGAALAQPADPKTEVSVPLSGDKTLERQSVDAMARGAYAEAAVLYDRLSKTSDDVFRDAARIARRKSRRGP